MPFVAQMKPRKNSKPKYVRLLTKFVLGTIAGFLVTYIFVAFVVPGPSVTAYVVYLSDSKDASGRGPIGCPQYELYVHSVRRLDFLHLEVQFPERIGNHQIATTPFKNAAQNSHGKILSGKTLTRSLGLDEYCNFAAPQEALPNSIDYRWYNEPASKVVINATDFSGVIFGVFAVPNRMTQDPIQAIQTSAGYRYSAMGLSNIERRLDVVVRDARRAQHVTVPGAPP